MDPSHKQTLVDKNIKLKCILRKEEKMKDPQRNKKGVMFMINMDEDGEEGGSADEEVKAAAGNEEEDADTAQSSPTLKKEAKKDD